MANYSSLKNALAQVIKPNDNQEITGQIMQDALMAMINALGAGYQFAGVPTAQTDPSTPDQNVFYIAGAGTYPNFGATVVPRGSVGVFRYNGEWDYTVLDVASWADASNKLYYNTQAGNVAAKTIQADGFTLQPGGWLKVHFDNANTVDNPTLNVNNTGAHTMTFNGRPVSATNSWKTGETVAFYYDNYGVGIWRGIRLVELPDFLNVNDLVGQSTPFASASAARSVIPQQNRKPGLNISYLLSTGENTSQWVQDMFIGDDVTDWGVADNWKTIGFVSVSQNSQTNKIELLIGDTPVLVVDNEPEVGSDNLVKSGGVKKLIGGTKIEVKQSDGAVWMFSNFLKGFIGESVYIRSKQFTIPCMLYDNDVQLDYIGTTYTQVDLSNVSNPRILVSSGYSQSDSFSLDIIPQSLLKELINTNTAAINSLGSNVHDLANDVSEIQEFINPKDYFSDAVVGYITPDGKYSSSDIGAVVTQAIPVQEGDVLHFEGGWQDNAQFGSVWGYTGLSFNNGVKILDCLAYQSVDFVIPAGVNYLRAWSLTSKNPSIFSTNNLDNKISEIIAEKVKIDWDNAEVITATRNAADYNSIREIMQSITDATVYRPYTIFVPAGRWHECDIQGKKYVRIVGEDRERTIIYNDGTSSQLTPSDYSYPSESNKMLSSVDKIYKHIIFAKDDVYVENVTLELTTGKYCAHLDNADFSNVTLKNCHLIGEDVNYDIGIGIRGGQHINIDKCVIESVDTGKLGVFAHNWNNQAKASYLNITDCYFKKCGFICIDELGSEQEDAWNLINCYSDFGGAVNVMVDVNGDGKTFWINPTTGENESNPQNVPYCIKLNCCGSNVGKFQKNRFGSTTTIARPDILKYIIADCILAVDGEYAVDSHICGYVSGNSVTIGESDNTALPFVGVVDSIVDGICYIVKKGHTIIVSINNIYGLGAGIGSLVYRRDNGYLTTMQSQSIDNIAVGIIWGDFYGVGRQIVLF